VFALARFSTSSIYQEKFRRVIFQTDPLPPGPPLRWYADSQIAQEA
jgi:hypothetical protein